MISIDASQKSGSGTIVRYALALAALLGEELHLTNIRAKRSQPGLRPQHLKAAEALSELCQGTLKGGRIGASEITFKPGGRVKGGRFEWDIGTAGSTTMLLMTIIPAACFAQGSTSFRITGGLFQDFAPSAHHMQHLLFPSLARMGLNAQLEIVRPGYVPRGGGIIEVKVEPLKVPLKPLSLPQQGQVTGIEGIALSSRLKERKVSERLAQTCQKALQPRYQAQIRPIYDTDALQAGAALAVWAHTSSGAIIGADMAGAPRRSSEEIAERVARSLLEDLATGATVDRYLADQLILYAALAEGVTEYRIPRMTEHVETNLWLVERILGVTAEVKDNRVSIKGMGYRVRR